VVPPPSPFQKTTWSSKVEAKVIVRCPEMPVLATINPLVRMAQELPCEGEVQLPYQHFSFGVTFPRCPVRWVWFGEWAVDAVIAEGNYQWRQPTILPSYPKWVFIAQLGLAQFNEHLSTGAIEKVFPFVSINLPKELVVRTSWNKMLAEPVEGDINVTFVDGAEGKGRILFPKCEATWVGLGKYLAEAVTAEGKVVFP
jgi:hypothetical protein